MIRILEIAGVFAALLASLPAASQPVSRNKETRVATDSVSAGRVRFVSPVPSQVNDRARHRESSLADQMTPKELRQLRRDILRHGRELYTTTDSEQHKR